MHHPRGTRCARPAPAQAPGDSGLHPADAVTLAKEAFSDPAWVYEPKLDGRRSLLWRRSTLRLITRNEKDRTSHYSDLVEALLRHETSPLIAEGECPGMRWRVALLFL